MKKTEGVKSKKQQSTYDLNSIESQSNCTDLEYQLVNLINMDSDYAIYLEQKDTYFNDDQLVKIAIKEKCENQSEQFQIHSSENNFQLQIMQLQELSDTCAEYEELMAFFIRSFELLEIQLQIRLYKLLNSFDQSQETKL